MSSSKTNVLIGIERRDNGRWVEKYLLIGSYRSWLWKEIVGKTQGKDIDAKVDAQKGAGRLIQTCGLVPMIVI